MKKLSVLTLLIVLAASIFIAVAQTPSEELLYLSTLDMVVLTVEQA